MFIYGNIFEKFKTFLVKRSEQFWNSNYFSNMWEVTPKHFQKHKKKYWDSKLFLTNVNYFLNQKLFLKMWTEFEASKHFLKNMTYFLNKHLKKKHELILKALTFYENRNVLLNKTYCFWICDQFSIGEQFSEVGIYFEVLDIFVISGKRLETGTIFNFWTLFEKWNILKIPKYFWIY